MKIYELKKIESSKIIKMNMPFKKRQKGEDNNEM
jgi:hypothetical protein